MKKKRDTSHDKPNAAIDPPAKEALVVDAGAAPVEFIKQARPLSVDVTALDAGPPRISVLQPRAEPPLNPLRAGSAIAKGGPQVSAVVSPADTEGGAAPKPPTRKKNQPILTRNSKARLRRSRKRKR